MKAIGRILLSLLLLGSFLRATAKEEPMALADSWGTLRGTLWSPDRGSDTAVILIAGSGPTDRYGNSRAGTRTRAYALLAEELMKAGYAVLSYDKRGIAASPYNNPEELLTDCHFTYFVEDAERWIEELQRLGYRHILLAGHSEGALIALLAANRHPEVAGVISLCGAAYPIDEILKVQLAAQLLAVDYALYAKACRIIDTLKRGETPSEVPQALASLFPAYLNTYYHEWMASDPREAARSLHCPLLIIGGGRDLQVSTANAHALKEACPTAQLHLFERMAHTLKDSEGKTTQEQMDAYTNPTLPLSEGVAEAIVTFIRGL